MRLEEWFFHLAQRASSDSSVGQHVSVGDSWDVASLLPVVVVSALLLVFCCLLPGVRRRRLHSSVVVLWSACTAFGLICAYTSPSWAVLDGRVHAVLSFASPRRSDCHLVARFGLHGADLELSAAAGAPFRYREQFVWPLTPRGMTELYRGALRRGVAAPLVTALEVLSKDAAPCTWGRHFRRAGYMAGWLVAVALAGWLLGLLLLTAVPWLAARTMCVNGALTVGSAVVYRALMPSHSMVLRFDGVELHVRMSWCFWLVVAVGLLNLLLGVWLLVEEWSRPGFFSSVFELDFGEPHYRYGWQTASKKPSSRVKPRRDELKLNVDFPPNDLSGADHTPSDERFSTPCFEPAQQPLWTPGSMPRRSLATAPPPDTPKTVNVLYPPLAQALTPEAVRPTCHRRTPCKTGRTRSLSDGGGRQMPRALFQHHVGPLEGPVALNRRTAGGPCP